MADNSLFSRRSTARRIAAANSVAVIGLGRFGSALALELMAGDTEVLGIDTDDDLVQSFNGVLTQVVRADATREEVLRQLAIDEFDRVVVAIGSDVTASILTCSVLLQLELPVIWAKAVDPRHALILKQLGVHRVIRPEEEMGKRVAHLVRGAAQDYMEIEPGYAMIKSVVPEFLRGIRLGDSTIRREHGVTVAAFRREGGVWSNADADTVLRNDDTILVVGPTHNAESFAQLR